MLLDVGFADFLERRVGRTRVRCLNQTTFYDTGHPLSPYDFVEVCAIGSRRISSQ
jgi:hypothetical protein